MAETNPKPAGRGTRTIEWIVSNVPIIVTVVVATLIAIATTLWEFAVDQLLQLIALLLVLIALSLITERLVDGRKSKAKQDEMAAGIVELVRALGGRGQGLDKLIVKNRELPPLEDRVLGARKISISGGSLVRLASDYKHTFENLVLQGCHIRLLFVNPDHPAAEQMHAAVVTEEPNFEEYKRKIRRAIENLGAIEDGAAGKLEVRMSAFVPPYSLVAVERHPGDSTIQVQIYPFKMPARDRPTLLLDKEETPNLHKVFGEQFEAMWDSEYTESAPT